MKLRIGFIGSGSRSASYGCHLKKHGVEVEYPAICDTNPEFSNRFNEFYADGKAAIYSDYRELLANHPDLDGIVIGTPNDQHEHIAVDCLKANAHILLEKPLATTPQACLNILNAKQASGKSVTLGFVLRYTPFYKKLREIAQSGVCGRIQTVTAEEYVNTFVTRILIGGWRRSEARSGGALLEKCCHDLDIFNWIMGRMPVSVHSFGSSTAFPKNPDAGPRCRDCRITANCPYYFNINDYSLEAQKAHEWGFLVTWTDTCLYDGGAEICDHQVVSFEYADGALLNFTMTFNSDIHTRTTRIVGTNGHVQGDTHTKEISMGSLKPSAHEKLTIADDGSGHDGGDGEICRSFIQSMTDPTYKPSATIEDGFHSAMVAFAADRSRLECRRVRVAELYEELGLEFPPLAGEALPESSL